MGRAWLIIVGTDPSAPAARFDLKPGLTVLGGARGDVAVPASGNDCVHIWSEPPKLIFVGAGVPPLVNGQPAPEVPLHSGNRIEWRGIVATFGCEAVHERLEEIPAAWMNPAGGAHAPVGESGSVSGASPWRWLKAGLVAEMSLADSEAIKRWQDASARGEFDAESASRDLLAAAPGLRDDDPRITERCTKLMRELLMAPVAKRPPRQSSKSSRGCFAALFGQFMILVLITLIVVAGLLVARTRYSQSIDAQLDRILKMF